MLQKLVRAVLQRRLVMAYPVGTRARLSRPSLSSPLKDACRRCESRVLAARTRARRPCHTFFSRLQPLSFFSAPALDSLAAGSSGLGFVGVGRLVAASEPAGWPSAPDSVGLGSALASPPGLFPAPAGLFPSAAASQGCWLAGHHLITCSGSPLELAFV
jgi:hypothetical protein